MYPVTGTALTDPFVRLCLVVSGSSEISRDQWNCTVSILFIRKEKCCSLRIF
jgi:hypothetical protein